MPKPQSAGKSCSTAENTVLTEEAASWFLRMQQSDGNDTEQKAFEAWLSQSSAHRVEYQQYARLWHNLDYLERKPQKKFSAAVAGLLVSVFLFGAVQWLSHIEDVIVTAIGEREQIVLADGTTIDINTDTKLRLALYGFTRKATVEHGEALFKIGSERFRTFEVHAGNGVIQHIGTEFNVTRENDKTTVAVLEGAVEIRLENRYQIAIVHGGQQISYTEQSLLHPLPTDTETVAAWRKNRLIFRNTPLNEVVRQINRYHTRPVKLGEPQFNDLTVSGEFNAEDRDGLIQALKTLFPLRSSELDDMTVLYAEK